MQLDVSAIYHVVGDVVHVVVSVFDGSVSRTDNIKSGTISLKSANGTVQSTSFSRLNGSSDNAVHVNFLHPALLYSLKVDVSVELTSGTILTLQRSVISEGGDSTVLSLNPSGSELGPQNDRI